MKKLKLIPQLFSILKLFIIKKRNRMNKMKPQIIILDGPSGAGKSTILEYLRSKFQSEIFVGTKLTTRRKRIGDTDWEFRFVDAMPLNSEYVFNIVGNFYAIDDNEISHAINKGFTYTISCTDREVLNKLKAQYNLITIYIYRNLSESQFQEIQRKRGVLNGPDLQFREDEFKSFFKTYIQNINLYDRVILNIGSKEDLYKQFSLILSGYNFISN